MIPNESYEDFVLVDSTLLDCVHLNLATLPRVHHLDEGVHAAQMYRLTGSRKLVHLLARLHLHLLVHMLCREELLELVLVLVLVLL